jgi:BolA protein
MTMTHASTSELERLLREHFAPSELLITDDSAAHAGHAGAREGSHFSVRIVSERFTGLHRLGRHRLVYHALGPLMTAGIHALALETRSPEES